jgi:hypothetical protein
VGKRLLMISRRIQENISSAAGQLWKILIADAVSVGDNPVDHPE